MEYTGSKFSVPNFDEYIKLHDFYKYYGCYQNNKLEWQCKDFDTVYDADNYVFLNFSKENLDIVGRTKLIPIHKLIPKIFHIKIIKNVLVNDIKIKL